MILCSGENRHIVIQIYDVDGKGCPGAERRSGTSAV